MTRRPETRYAWNGDVALAYQVFGAGPVGIFAAKSAWLLGAGRVIVVDSPGRAVADNRDAHVRQAGAQ